MEFKGSKIFKVRIGYLETEALIMREHFNGFFSEYSTLTIKVVGECGVEVVRGPYILIKDIFENFTQEMAQKATTRIGGMEPKFDK